MPLREILTYLREALSASLLPLFQAPVHLIPKNFRDALFIIERHFFLI